MCSAQNYDELLYSILCTEGNVMGFFDKIFDFLHRRTDYFLIKCDESCMDDPGLNPGEAEDILRSMFRKYVEICQQNLNLKSDIDPVPPDYAVEVTVVTSEPETALNLSELESVIAESEPELGKVTTEEKSDDQSKEESSNSEEKQHPEKQGDAKIPVMDPDCYNGAYCDGYTWAQTLKDSDIRIKVPSDITLGKQVRVSIQQTHLKIEVLGKNEWNILKEGDFSWKINVEESTWTLVPHEHIHVCLQKMKERWWDAFFVGEPKIDLKAIDPSIAYEELDRDSQVKIEELMYNEHLKRLGKPSIQETKLHDILKGAWNADGSPFKGQPFNPSLVKIQNSENFTL